jgi:hypothetical protein
LAINFFHLCYEYTILGTFEIALPCIQFSKNTSKIKILMKAICLDIFLKFSKRYQEKFL